MAYLWFRSGTGPYEWSVVPLAAEITDISADPPQALVSVTDPEEPPLAVVVLVRAAVNRLEYWVLLAPWPSEVRINGFQPVAGIHVLHHRDEIRIDGRPSMFFSRYRPPEMGVAHFVEGLPSDPVRPVTWAPEGC